MLIHAFLHSSLPSIPSLCPFLGFLMLHVLKGAPCQWVENRLRSLQLMFCWKQVASSRSSMGQKSWGDFLGTLMCGIPWGKAAPMKVEVRSFFQPDHYLAHPSMIRAMPSPIQSFLCYAPVALQYSLVQLLTYSGVPRHPVTSSLPDLRPIGLNCSVDRRVHQQTQDIVWHPCRELAASEPRTDPAVMEGGGWKSNPTAWRLPIEESQLSKNDLVGRTKGFFSGNNFVYFFFIFCYSRLAGGSRFRRFFLHVKITCPTSICMFLILCGVLGGSLGTLAYGFRFCESGHVQGLKWNWYVQQLFCNAAQRSAGRVMRDVFVRFSNLQTPWQQFARRFFV